MYIDDKEFDLRAERLDRAGLVSLCEPDDNPLSSRERFERRRRTEA
jgi:hypothetical protein